MDIAQEILATFNDDPDLFKKVITRGESWVYGYDIETRIASILMEASRIAIFSTFPLPKLSEPDNLFIAVLVVLSH